MGRSNDSFDARALGEEANSIFLANAEELGKVGCFEWDIQTNRVLWSDGLFKIYGLKPQGFEATLEAFIERVVPDDRAAVMQAVQSAIEGGGAFVSEERVVHTSGEILVLESRGQVLYDHDGKPTKLIGVCRDVTQSVRDRRQQAKQIEGLKLLAATASAMMVSRDEVAWLPLLKDITRHLGCDGFTNFDFFENALHLAACDGFSNELVEQLLRLELGQQMCGVCAATREFICVSGSELEEHPQGKTLWENGYRSFVSVPLILDGRLLGTLSFVAKHCRHWDESERDFVKTVGQLFAAAKGGRFYGKQIAESEQRYRAIVNSTADALVLFDFDGRILDVNRETCESLAYTREELLSMNVMDIAFGLPEEFKLGFKSLSGGAPRLLLGRHRRRDGSEFSVEIRANAINYRGHQAVLSAVRDTSERMEIEAQKRRAEETSRLVLEHAKMVTWEAEPETLNFGFLNGSCVELLGFAAEHWLEPGFWLGRIHEIDRAQILEKIRHAHAEGMRFEFRMQHADGHFLWAEIIVEGYVKHDGQRRLRGVLSDISPRKALEERLRHSQKMEAIGRLAGGVSHDFNNLLTVINTYADLILLRSKPEEVHYESIQAIQDAVERAKGLTNQLLMFGRNSVNRQLALNLNRIVDDLQRLLTRLIGEDIELTAILAPDLPNIVADPSQIDQVIVNLVLNARDAMPQGGRLQLATSLVTLSEYEGSKLDLTSGDYVELRVSDSGCGMAEEVRSKVFEPFFTTKQIGQGSGLGLSVAYGVVREAGGVILVTSTPGTGSEFRILLPATQQSTQKQEKDSLATPASGFERILLVEDELAVRQAASQALRLFGYEVLEAGSGAEARSVASNVEGEIALLLTDLVMPEVGGIELADEIRQKYPNVKVLCLSGYSDQFVRVEQPGYPLLAKPFTLQSLAHKVREVLDASSANSSTL